jgi:hypothetical protein
VLWYPLRVTSSRPYGTFRLSNLYPGLRTWAKFSRPCGTHLAIVGFSHTLFSASAAKQAAEKVRTKGTGLAVPYRTVTDDGF